MESIITSRAYIDIPHKPILLSGCIPGQKTQRGAEPVFKLAVTTTKKYIYQVIITLSFYILTKI